MFGNPGQVSNHPAYLFNSNIDDPIEFFAWFIQVISGPPGTNMMPMQIPGPIISYLCQLAWDAGFRLVPEKATKFKLPLQPNMGSLDPGRWVDRDEYLKWIEDNKSDPAMNDPAREKALELLKDHNPLLYETLLDADVVAMKQAREKINPKDIERAMNFLGEFMKQVQEDQDKED